MNSKTNKEKRLSPYFPYVRAKKSKAFLLGFAEFSLTFILTFILFIAAGYPLSFSTNYVKDANVALADKQAKLNEIVLSTKLASKSSEESSTLDDPSIMVRSYIEALTKTSLYVNSLPFRENSNDGKGNVIEKEIDKESTLFNLDNDPVGYYFYVFKPSHSPIDNYIYDDADYSSKKDEFLYKKAYVYEEENRFVQIDDSISKYSQISKVEAKILNDYLIYGHEEDKPTYNYYGNAFLRARSVFIEEIETRYTPYMQITASFMEDYHVYVSSLTVAICLSYLLSFIILQVVVPLVSKNKRGVSAYMLKMGYCKDDGGEVGIKEILLRASYNLFSYLSPCFLALYFIGYGELAFMELFGFVSLFYICLMSFIFTIASFIYMMVSSSNRGLGEKLASIEIKDLNMMEPNLPLSDKEIENGTKEPRDSL